MDARLSGDGDRGRAIDDGLRQSVLGARSVLDFQCVRFEIHGMMSQGGSQDELRRGRFLSPTARKARQFSRQESLEPAAFLGECECRQSRKTRYYVGGGRPHTVEVTGSNPVSTGPTGRERSRSAAGGAVLHDAGNDSFDPIAPAGEGNERAWGSKARDLFRATDCRWILDDLGARSRKVGMNK
jgi:hypothetical protein